MNCFDSIHTHKQPLQESNWSLIITHNTCQVGGRRFGQIIRKRERRRGGRIMQRWMRQLWVRTGETGEREVVNIWEKCVCVCHREVVASGRRLLGQRENWKNKREMMLLHTDSKAWESRTHTAMQLPFEPSGSWEKAGHGSCPIAHVEGNPGSYSS